MSDEDRLRERLHEQAGDAHVVVDIDDVAARIHGRGRGRLRSVAATCVLALVVGTVGGFAAGRSGRGSAPGVVASPGSSSNGTAPLAPTVEEGHGRPLTVSTRLFVRTTSDGVTIRVYELAGSMIGDGATSVRAYQSVEAEMSTDAAVTMTTSGWSGPSALALGAMSPGSFGEGEHAPAQWLVVQAQPGVARVRASFVGGGTDEMQPEHGVAVLAHVGSGPPERVDALDAQGHVTFSDTVPRPECDSGCGSATGSVTTIPAGANPPGLELPAPGGEQPADVPAARQAVTQAFAGAFDGAATDATRVRAVEGGTALVSVFEALRHGPNATAVQHAQTVVEGVVFLTPATAVAKFHSVIAPGSDSGPYLGRAVLTGTGWQVTRTSYCELAALAGAKCP